MFITEIPLDVFINICEFLNPLDVLSLGECTRQLHSFSKTRSLWISLTQRMIQSNSLYAPSFPIPKLTTRQLQQVACAPTRMIERFRNVTFGGESAGSDSAYEKERDGRYRINKQLANPLGAKDPSPLLFPPVAHSNDRPMRIVYPPEPLSSESSAPVIEDEDEPVFEKICSIPGGRFLVATYGKEAMLLDLGVAGYTIADEGVPQNLVQIPIYARWRHHGDDFFMPGPSRDGKELRMAMGGSFDGDNATMPLLSIVRVWEEESDDAVQQTVDHNDNISPIRSVRVVQHYAPLPPNHVDCLSFFTLVGDLFIYAYAADANPHDEDINTNRIHVWNFIEDESVEWEIDEGQYKELFIDGDYVVMITFPDIVGWKIPPLKPVKRQAPSPESTAFLSSSSQSIYTFAPIPVLPLYPPTFRIPLITNPDPHLTEPHQDGSHSNISSTAASVAYSLSELNDLNYNPLNDLDTMLIGRMLDWYNVDMKVRKFDAAFGRGGYYGFLSYGVDGWPVGEGGDVVDRRYKGSITPRGRMTTRGCTTPAVATKIIRRDPRIVLESAMYFKGDVVNGVGLVMDPFRVCDGYTVKNVVASDGRAYVMVHDQSDEDDEEVERHANANVEEGQGGEGPKSLADRLWTPKKVVTVELAVPGDDKREERRGRRDYDDEDDEDEEEEDDIDEDETNQSGPSQGEGVGEVTTGSHGGAVTGAEETRTGEMSFGAEGGEVSGSGVAHEAEDEDDGMCTCSHSNKNDNDVASNERQGDDHHDEVDANAEDPNNPTPNVVSEEEAKTVYSNFKTEEQREVLPMIPDEGAVRGRSDISFDPCSGRFCFIDKKRKMIGVVDYLRWG